VCSKMCRLLKTFLLCLFFVSFGYAQTCTSWTPISKTGFTTVTLTAGSTSYIMYSNQQCGSDYFKVRLNLNIATYAQGCQAFASTSSVNVGIMYVALSGGSSSYNICPSGGCTSPVSYDGNGVNQYIYTGGSSPVTSLNPLRHNWGDDTYAQGAVYYALALNPTTVPSGWTGNCILSSSVLKTTFYRSSSSCPPAFAAHYLTDSSRKRACSFGRCDAGQLLWTAAGNPTTDSFKREAPRNSTAEAAKRQCSLSVCEYSGDHTNVASNYRPMMLNRASNPASSSYPHVGFVVGY